MSLIERIDFLSNLMETESCGIEQRTLPKSVIEAVFRRDRYCCRVCHFASYRYQEIALLDGNSRDIDSYIVACIPCWQCLRPSQATAHKSGFVVSLPEVSQLMINRAAFDLYSMRIAGGHIGELVEAFFERISRARSEVFSVLSGDPLSMNILELKGKLWEMEAKGDRFMTGLRLFPADKYMAKDRNLEFNMFPQMLAFFRSANGPIRRPIDVLNDTDSAAYRILKVVVPLGLQSCLEKIRESGNRTSRTHFELGSKLLRDAASFFETIGEQNPGLRHQMSGNSGIFLQVATLLESDPTGTFKNDNESNPGGKDIAYQEIAAKLLRDAAGFFEHIGDANLPLEKQMTENSAVFRDVAQLIAADVMGVVEENDVNS